MQTDLVVFEQCEADIVKFEEVNAELSFDVTTEDGEKECKTYLAKLRKVRNRIEKLRKDTKKQYLEAGRAVDAEAKAYMARVDAMHEIHNAPIRALEQKRLDAEIDKREKEQAEAKAAEEKRLAELAAREAEVAAKEAEIKAKEDAANAEANRLAAIEEGKRQAEREAQAEKDRIATEEAARVADQEHRKKYNRAAAESLDHITGDTDISVAVIIAIVSGAVPNVTMNY